MKLKTPSIVSEELVQKALDRLVESGEGVPDNVTVSRNTKAEESIFKGLKVVRNVQVFGLNEKGELAAYLKGYNKKGDVVVYLNAIKTCPPSTTCDED